MRSSPRPSFETMESGLVFGTRCGRASMRGRARGAPLEYQTIVIDARKRPPPPARYALPRDASHALHSAKRRGGARAAAPPRPGALP